MDRSRSAGLRPWFAEELPGNAVREMAVPEADGGVSGVYVATPLINQACFILYRDNIQKKLVSVCAL